MKKLKSEKALLSLEACISVTIFMFFMLFLYSFFGVFEARNEMAHVLLSTANSMSLDTYENEKLQNSGDISSLISGIYNNVNSSGNGFTSSNLWNEVKKEDVEGTWDGTIYATQTDPNSNVTALDEYGKQANISTLFTETIKERFVAYLANGDINAANEILEKYHIQGGIDGLDFSGSHIKSGKLYISIRYTIEYEFNVFDLGKLEMEQSVCSKLWS